MTWFRMFHPSALFFLGAAQANLPYVLWLLGYPRPEAYNFSVSYVPTILWLLAFGAFCVGVLLSRILFAKSIAPKVIEWDYVDQRRVLLLGNTTMVALIIQIALVINLYGVIPVFAFWSGHDIWDVISRQSDSGFGQLGLMLISIFILNAILLTGIAGRQSWRRRNKVFAILTILVLIFATLFGGTRQTLAMVMSALFFVCVATGAHPFNIFLQKMGYRGLSNWKTSYVIVVFALVVIFIMGFFGYLRSGAISSYAYLHGVDEIILYMSLPLINMEGLWAAGGWDGGRFEPVGMFAGLVPFKWLDIVVDNLDLVGDVPQRLEPSASYGLVGLYWSIGIPGLMLYCGVIGAISMYFYLRSRSRVFALLAYSQITWALLGVHTYNHFLALAYVPAPLLVFFFLSKLLVRRRSNAKRDRRVSGDSALITGA